MNALYAGIDVGGTSLKSLVVNGAGEIVEANAYSTASSTISQLTSVASGLVASHPGIAGIGIVVPGTVDEKSGTVGYASNLDLSGVNIPAAVTDAAGRPALLGHDGRGAGLAESLFGAAKGYESSVVIPIGTGISASLCFPGMVWPGQTHQSGEIGHIPVDPEGEPCACGQRGCMEVYASAKGIARRYSAATGENVGALEVERRLGSDPVADAVWARAIEALATVLTQLTLTLDPGCIVIGGGLSGAGDTLLEPLRARVASVLAWRTPPPIIASALGDRAGQWGAAVLASRAAGSQCYREWTPEVVKEQRP